MGSAIKNRFSGRFLRIVLGGVLTNGGIPRTAVLVAGLLAVIAMISRAGAQDVTTWHYDNARTGVQPLEKILTPANVNATKFGKLFSLPVLGDVYAQPLYLNQYKMADGQLHNVLLVATEEDYVYAFDTEGKNPAQGYLWRVSLLGKGETWAAWTDVGVPDIKPNIGITGTPVLDRATGVLYVVAKSKTTSGTTTFYQRLHALSIASGAEMLSGPTTIAATVKGLGDGGTTVSFNAMLNNQRPSLLLAPTPSVGSGNSVFIGWASHGDIGTYHGWMVAYDAADIAKQNGAWTDTPNGVKGGIWMSGGGVSSDDDGDIYFADGNGTFDQNSGGPDFGDTAFRMTLTSTGLVQKDFFTPANQVSLNNVDNDMGTSALTLLPKQSGKLPDLLVTTDKSGEIYLINRDKMGGYGTPEDSCVQNFSNGGYAIHNSLAWFNNTMYLGGDAGPLEAWTFNPTTELFTTTAQSKSSATFGCSGCDGSGSTPSISANGTADGIVWALDNSEYNRGPAVLHAYDPANLATEYYNSTQAANSRDAAAIATKFTTPTIAGGQVYVGGRNVVTVYGLFSSSAPAAATPTFSPAAGTYPSIENVSLEDSTPDASIYYTTNGTAPTTGSTLYTGPIQVTVSGTLQAIAIAPHFAQSDEAMAAYSIKAERPTAVALTSVANTYGIYSDGTTFTTGGLDGAGDAYSSTLLASPIVFNGFSYTLLAANEKNMVSGKGGTVIPLTEAKFASLSFLGTAVNAAQKAQVFTVTYTDGTTTQFTQSLSSWATAENYAGETLALDCSWRDTASGGRQNQNYNLYQYSFPLNTAKEVKSLTMPNNADVAIAAITLI